MRNSNAVITDSEDDDSTSTESDTETKVKNWAPFCVDEKLLAYHRRMIYEAKVLAVDPKTKRFLIHYLGWSKKWDEWVGIERLMKHNEENLQKQKALEKDHPEMITKSGRLFFLKPRNFNVTNSKKRKTMPKDNASSGKLVNVQIPTLLITHLVNYCEYITHMGKLVKLPCSPNVDDILTLYLDHRSNKDDRASDSAGEILNGLRCYFDKALPAMLLYKCERQQYEEATANGISPSKIYGAEHLLRLFVKLPEILYYANIEEETVIELQHKLQDFLKFLKKKKNNFFQSTYESLGGASTIK
ncbi:chromo/chromo shadow domain, MRG domain protein [Artemisia annua]|uniref:Chromo/chromo shadow domain, MRG domain protein n=1 Tax=Artemisia annua TaxID=35608 RepID=A0A2U1NDP8_ARTAN|nr:chromo/chromo shadow domain, MRG domain protein [Artemisia annua]